MNSKHTLLTLLSLLFVFVGCDTEDELIDERLDDNPLTELNAEAGSVDFSKYVAVGNSLTAGFMDAALYTNGQDNAFPNILAQHLEDVGIDIGAFSQPDIDSQNGFNTSANDLSNPSANPAGRFVLDIANRVPVALPDGEFITPFDGDKSALNNFGVPGMRVIEAVVPGYGLANPFFGRFASDPATASVLGDAVAAQGTFFTLWLGSNDALGWALAGGSLPDGEATPAAEAMSGTLTSINSFRMAYQATVNSLLTNESAQGVAITIPPVTLLPFFRLVPPRPVPLDKATADLLNQRYAGYNNGLNAALALGLIDSAEAATRQIAFAAGEGNGIVMQDDSLEVLDISFALGEAAGTTVLPNIRQTNDTDLLPLSVGALLGQEVSGRAYEGGTFEGGPFGLAVPATDAQVLTQAEQAQLIGRVAQYNQIIAQTVAATNGRVALLDINPLFADLFGLSPTQALQLGLGEAAAEAADGTQGIPTDEAVLLPDFSPSGIFSTDGIHPNPKGHAIVANAVVRTLNENFQGTDIPAINIAPYATVSTL